MLGVLIKARLDRLASREKHGHDLVVIERELLAVQVDKLIERRQRVFAATLADTCRMYDEVRLARQRRQRGETDDVAYVQALQAISPAECQRRIASRRGGGMPAEQAG